MIQLTPLLVRIGLKAGAKSLRAAYPDFNAIDKNLRQSMDWSAYIDQYGGWLYDTVAGHIEDDPAAQSPRGIWLGMLLVPAPFAAAAAAHFPEQCEILTDAEAERFYEDRVTVDQPEEFEDVPALQAIAARLTIEAALGITPSPKEQQRRAAALDPTKKTPGIIRNDAKTWHNFKNKNGWTIAAPS